LSDLPNKGKNEMAKKRVLTAADSLALRQVSNPQISPDGTQIIYVATELDQESKKYHSHLWLIATDGGKAKQLTSRPANHVEPRWSPDGRTIALVSNRPQEEGEDHKRQIWLLPADGGEATQLTQIEGGVHDIEWSPDGRSLLFLSCETPGAKEKELLEKGGIRVVDRFIKMHQVWTVDAATGRCRQLTRDHSSKAAATWSPDGERIAFEQHRDSTCNQDNRASLWIIDADGKNPRRLTRGDGCATRPRFSPDGEQIAFLRRARPCYYYLNQLAVVPSGGGDEKVLTEKLDRSVLDLCWSSDARPLHILVHDGVRQHFHSISAASGRMHPITEGNRVLSGLHISSTARRMAFVSSSSSHPGEIHIAALDGSGEKQLTRMNPKIKAFRTGRTRILSWHATDGLKIEGLLLLPSKYRRGHPLPLITDPHGGPAGSRACDFYPQWQVLAGLGYAVFSPNFRGSAGYGQDFLCANEDDFGGGDFGDLMTGIDMLVEKGIADPKRLGIMGYSYGGFMTAWSVGQTDRFKAAIAGAGVINLHSFFGTTDIQWFTRAYQRGTPWKNPDSYIAQSPITYVGRVSTPTLIYHGDEDRRVPMEQSEQLYVALRERNVPVEFVRYPREGHGLAEYHHQLDILERTVAWFDRYVKGAKAKGRKST
jgi:dipeptidyl aminopeptidase/acylaminoacyl peptidase